MTCCHFAKDEKSWLNNEQKRNKKDTEEVDWADSTENCKHVNRSKKSNHVTLQAE